MIPPKTDYYVFNSYHYFKLSAILSTDLTAFRSIGRRRSRNEGGHEEEEGGQDVLDDAPDEVEIQPMTQQLNVGRRGRPGRRVGQREDGRREVEVRPDPHRVVRHGRDDEQHPTPRDVPIQEPAAGSISHSRSIPMTI